MAERIGSKNTRRKSVTARAPVSARAPVPQAPGRAWRFLTFTAKISAPVLVLVLAAVSYAGLKATKPEVPQRPVREQVWPVKTVKAHFSDHQPSIRLYGQTSAGRRVELRALVPGEVLETGKGLKEGGQVIRGEMLLRVDPFQFRGALLESEAKLAEARAKAREIEAMLTSERDGLRRAGEQLKIAQRDLKRAIPLVEKGSISKKVADDRRMIVSEREQSAELRANNLSVQQARVEQQRAIITQLEWKVRQAKRNLEDTELKAPFDAYVSEVKAEIGRIVSANDPVATLLDRNWIEVRFTLTNAQYGRIVSAHGDVTGRQVNVLWHIGDTPVRYKAVIGRVASQISAASGGVDVYARITNPNSPVPLRPGAFVEVHVTDKLYSNVVKLPQTALYGNDRVYVVDQGKLVLHKVELVGATGTDILVRGKFIPGDPVMVTRLSKAEAGLRVQEQ